LYLGKEGSMFSKNGITYHLHGVVMYMTINIVIILVVSNEVSVKYLKLCFSLLNIHPIVLIVSPCM
jgi:hypothetical protein